MQDQILYFLKKSDNYLSGEEISHHLKISRAAVWKYIQELRQEGYDIVAVPHLGYHLVSCPDKLFPREIQFDLKTKIFGRKIFYFDTTTSTMDAAFRLGLEGVQEGTVVCAETQIKGRGRLGRHWVSPKGKGIYVSIILRPSFPPNVVSQLTILSAVAVAEALERAAALKPSIKWPNDLFIRGEKIAGILTELSAEMDRVRFVSIGIGLNVNTPSHLLPPHATSVKVEREKEFSRIDILQEILRRMEFWYEQFKCEGLTAIVERWKQFSMTLGRRICIHDSKGTVEGEAIDLDKDGALLIRTDTGMRIKKMTGDVIFL